MRLLQCKKSLKSCTTCLKVKDHSKSLFLLRHSFALNIGPDDKDITMHINPRFNAHGDENTVVCNSYEGGNWCEEQREGCFPFQLGEEFKVRGPAHVCVCPVRPCVCSLQHTSSFLATPDGKCVSLHQIYTLRGIWEVVSAGVQQMFNTNFPLDVFLFISFSCTCPSVLGDHHIHPIRVPGQFFRRLHNQFPQPHGCGEVLLPQLRWGRSHHQH